MVIPATILYGLLLILLSLFIRRARGKTLDDLLAERVAEHHRVHRVIAEHPRGGRWQAHKEWLKEAARH